MDKRTTEFLKMLDGKLDRARDMIATFAKKLPEDPATALEWSEGAFQAAAELRIFREVHTALSREDSKATLQSMRDYAARQVQRCAGRGWRSSSVPTNVLEDACTRAWAEVVDWVDGYLARQL